MVNITKEPSNADKIAPEEQIFEGTAEKYMEKILVMVNQNIQYALEKFRDTKNKEHEKTQKHINELREDLNKKVKQRTL
jgi:phage-related protein